MSNALKALGSWLAKAKSPGRVMGQTQSGKTVHYHPQNAGHKDFTEQDHLDAMDHHVNAQGPINHKLHLFHAGRLPMPPVKVSGLVHERDMHKKHALAHSDMADDVKSGVKKSIGVHQPTGRTSGNSAAATPPTPIAGTNARPVMKALVDWLARRGD